MHGIRHRSATDFANWGIPVNDVELMGVYLWNAHVCGALYPLIGMAEIISRNASDPALTAVLHQEL